MMCVWRLTSVCLSVAYIGPKSRIERPRKTKFGTEEADVTCDLDTTFKVKRSRSPGHFARHRVGMSDGCIGGRGNVLAVGNCCYVAVSLLGGTRRFGAHGGGEGRGISWRPPAYSLLVMHCSKASFNTTTPATKTCHPVTEIFGPLRW